MCLLGIVVRGPRRALRVCETVRAGRAQPPPAVTLIELGLPLHDGSEIQHRLRQLLKASVHPYEKVRSHGYGKTALKHAAGKFVHYCRDIPPEFLFIGMGRSRWSYVVRLLSDMITIIVLLRNINYN